ncbi:hypothetical protein [Diaphorobacter nitroreducens]|uniref:hypothetical protein n=1 Tax=Diaphorobacter nitroreducens TaxID=164759 RepID=UPI0028AD3652|nr:hypothetical protein [Diaphorobacter nitroreducens]
MLNKMIYLHIGTHKTGTTSIQSALLKNREKLLQNGIDFYLGNFIPQNHIELHIAAMMPKRQSPAKKMIGERGGDDFFRKIQIRTTEFIERSQCRKIVFSAEGLCYLRYDEELSKLAELLANCDVKVIVYFREKYQYLASYRRQLERMGIAPSAERDSFAYVEDDSWLVDNKATVKVFQNRFGFENIIVKSYDDEVRNCGTVVTSFLDEIGGPNHSLREGVHEWLNMRGDL